MRKTQTWLGQVLLMDLAKKLHCALQSLGKFRGPAFRKTRHNFILLQSAKVVIGDVDIEGAELVTATIITSGG
jgi:hypothetical protein